MRPTGFSFRWFLPALAFSFTVTAFAQAEPTEIVRGTLTIFRAPDLRPVKLPALHAPAAPRLRTVVLPEVVVTASPVQALPRGAHIDCGARRGVVEHGRRDARNLPLPSAARCL